MDCSIDVDSLHRATRLPRVEERAVDDVVDRMVERDIGAHVGRVLAAQLESRTDETIGGRALHRVTATHRAREGDERDSLVADHSCDLIVLDMQILKHTVGQPRRGERFRIPLGHERRLLRHLQNDGIAGQQRGDDRVHRREPGIIPRRQHEHDAERRASNEFMEVVSVLDLNVGERGGGDARM